MNETGYRNRNRRTALRLGVVVLGMFGFGFALVPLYDVICEVTGLNGRSSSLTDATSLSAVDGETSRRVTVEFVAIVDPGMGWTFSPEVTRMEVNPGKQYLVHYTAANMRDTEFVGKAVPSVSPSSAARHFNKTECFCFTRQAFGPLESREMPVAFVVDPRLPAGVERLTLAYTFFEMTDVAAAPASNQSMNGGE